MIARGGALLAVGQEGIALAVAKLVPKCELVVFSGPEEMKDALFQSLEKELLIRGHSKIFALVSREEEERSLLQQGWKWVHSTLVYRHDLADQSFPLKMKAYGNRKYDITLFSEISEDERVWFQSCPEIPKWANPFVPWDDSPLEPLNSVVLRKEGKIQGWLITHRISPTTIRYTQWRVMREVRDLQAGPQLLLDAVRRHFTCVSTIPKALWTSYNPKMIAHFFKQKQPLLLQGCLTSLKRMEKQLGS